MNTAKKLMMVLRGSGAAFSPLDITGLTLWLDASDSTTLFQASDGTTPAVADGDVVGYWGDKSGNGYNPIQATAARKPLRKDAILNGSSALLFDGLGDGTGDVLKNTTAARTQPQTVFAVFQTLTPTTSTSFILDAGTDPQRSSVRTASTTTLTINAGTALNLNSAGFTDFVIWTFVYNGASSAIYKAGQSAATGNAGAGAQNGITIGANAYLANNTCTNMYITDVLIYSGVLSDANRNAVGAWLAAKTGLNFTP